MIGLSLSLCIKDVIKGNVGVDEITLIVASTNVQNDPARLTSLIENYKQYYWYTAPEQAEAIVRKLYADGKVFEAREFKGEGPNVAHGAWLISYEDGVYEQTRMPAFIAE